MNFTEAMLYVSKGERSAVTRPDSRGFVWYDPDPWMAGGPPMGLYSQLKATDESARPYCPTIEDIIAEDWEEYDLDLDLASRPKF